MNRPAVGSCDETFVNNIVTCNYLHLRNDDCLVRIKEHSGQDILVNNRIFLFIKIVEKLHGRVTANLDHLVARTRNRLNYDWRQMCQ